MILFDTNVVSAIMRAEQEPVVINWLRQQQLPLLYIGTPTLFEVQFGIASLPKGRRRTTLEERFRAVLQETFADRILDFSISEALTAGEIHCAHISAGRNVDVPDSMIAGIARHVGATIATRNTKDIAGTGLQLINPWAVSS